MKIAGIVTLSVLVSGVVDDSALAHHSYQMFDTGKEVTLTGTLKSVEWTNPHVWLQVMVTKPNEQPVEYGFEGGGIGAYGRAGWHKRDLTIGDKVVVLANPMRTGEPGGNLIKLSFSNGAVLGRDGTTPDGKPVPVTPAAPIPTP